MLPNRGPSRPYSTVALAALRDGGIQLIAGCGGDRDDESSLSDSSLSDSDLCDKDDKGDSDLAKSQVEVPSDAALSEDDTGEVQAGADGEGERESVAEDNEGDSDSDSDKDCQRDAAQSEAEPAEEAPVEEAPVEEAPVEEAPVEEPPVEEAPVEEPPAEAPPAEEPPAEESKDNETQQPTPPTAQEALATSADPADHIMHVLKHIGAVSQSLVNLTGTKLLLEACIVLKSFVSAVKEHGSVDCNTLMMDCVRSSFLLYCDHEVPIFIKDSADSMLGVMISKLEYSISSADKFAPVCSIVTATLTEPSQSSAVEAGGEAPAAAAAPGKRRAPVARRPGALSKQPARPVVPPDESTDDEGPRPRNPKYDGQNARRKELKKQFDLINEWCGLGEAKKGMPFTHNNFGSVERVQQYVEYIQRQSTVSMATKERLTTAWTWVLHHGKNIGKEFAASALEALKNPEGSAKGKKRNREAEVEAVD
jgi:hypothetical protein